MTMTPKQVTDALKKAHELIQGGAIEPAIQLIQEVTLAAPRDVRAFTLMGVAHAQSGDLSASMAAFHRAVEIAPDHAGGWINLGNALLQDAQSAEAIEAFARAIQLAPDRVDPLYPLAVAHGRLGQTNDARRMLRKLLSLEKNHAAAWLLLAQLDQADGRLDDALAHYDRSLALDPTSALALHGKSTLLKQRKQYTEAITLAQRAVQLQPEWTAAHRNLGHCHGAVGDTERAIEAYTAGLKTDPLNTSLHSRLNHLLWLEGRSDFLESYQSALARHPQAYRLRRELAFKLIQVGRMEDAQEHTNWLVQHNARQASNHQLHGGVLRKRRQFEPAIQAHREAVRLDPASRDCQQELATSLMANWEARPALEILRRLRAAEGLHQGYIALEATALRILGREEYHELYDYDRLLLSSMIEPPTGFPSIQAFNQELNDYLLTLHTSREHPLDQSLVNGTQTIDDLFDDQHELIRGLKHRLDEATGRLLNALPSDDTHPTLSRNTRAFSYTGSWSVRLRSSGFHLNHYHGHGWLSGPYYVDLPSVIEDDAERQGWIQFGEPGFECVQPLPPDRVIQPEPGLMIRFPSYMWHGTIPFQSEQVRSVVSVDLAPVQGQ